ncbi:MAG: hypothetical protein FWG24_01930 [Eggerthellaceae bacterium]|jgi:uncharacterized protein (DUF697 family)|nr:hypothetical protein [Eggerthellaceae bacterium]MDR2721318.1 hypothetical protein [Coriobacteriaceae bacterium]
MQIPIDIKAIVNEATDVDQARNTPISVCVYLDTTAPADLQAFVRQAFAATSPHARVMLAPFPEFAPSASHGADIAVIVAGFDERISEYAAAVRAAGVPAMVLTTMPHIVSEQAAKSTFPLLECDLLSPSIPRSSKALAERAGTFAEPQDLSEENVSSLIRKMGEWIIATCPEKKLAFAMAFPFVRRTLSLEAVKATALQNAGVGLVLFIPGADMPVMTLNQAKMLLQIAAAYGQPMSAERAKELAVVVGGGFVFRSVARQVMSFVPALGWAVKAGIGYSGTFAMGKAAIEYFEGGGNIRGLGEVVNKAREKVVQAAAAASDQPKLNAAVKNVRDHAGAAGEIIVGRLKKDRD